MIPISDKFIGYATKVTNILKNNGIRVILNDRSDKIGFKIRQAEIEKINLMFVVGEKEEKNNMVSVRKRFEGDIGMHLLNDLLININEEIKNRSFAHRKETATTTK